MAPSEISRLLKRAIKAAELPNPLDTYPNLKDSIEGIAVEYLDEMLKLNWAKIR